MEIIELHSLSSSQIKDLQFLMKELAPTIEVTGDMLVKVIESNITHQFALVDDNGTIVGGVSLCVYDSPTGCKANIEDVVVSSSCRGLGYGRKLMEHLIDYAKTELAPIELHLTSNPKRVSANALYKAVGFEQRETNVYSMTIK